MFNFLTFLTVTVVLVGAMSWRGFSSGSDIPGYPVPNGINRGIRKNQNRLLRSEAGITQSSQPVLVMETVIAAVLSTNVQ